LNSPASGAIAEHMTETAPPLPSSADTRGRGAAFAVYVLYLLSIPSAAVFALIGVIVALVAQDDAGPLAKSHLRDQIRIWWIAFWWAVGLALAALIGWLLTLVLIGFAVLWVIGIIGFIVAVWFTVKSFFGLLALLDGRPR
jgi:uncharacterized membrane protein